MNSNLFNSFSLVGNIAKVNEIKEQSNGTKFRYFTICQNTKYKDKNGDVQEDANFYDIKIFEKNFNHFENKLEVGKYLNVIGKVKVYKDENKKNRLTLIGCDSRVLTKEKEATNNNEDLFEFDWLNDVVNEMEV